MDVQAGVTKAAVLQVDVQKAITHGDGYATETLGKVSDDDLFAVKFPVVQEPEPLIKDPPIEIDDGRSAMFSGMGHDETAWNISFLEEVDLDAEDTWDKP